MYAHMAMLGIVPTTGPLPSLACACKPTQPHNTTSIQDLTIRSRADELCKSWVRKCTNVLLYWSWLGTRLPSCIMLIQCSILIPTTVPSAQCCHSSWHPASPGAAVTKQHSSKGSSITTEAPDYLGGIEPHIHDLKEEASRAGPSHLAALPPSLKALQECSPVAGHRLSVPAPVLLFDTIRDHQVGGPG